MDWGRNRDRFHADGFCAVKGQMGSTQRLGHLFDRSWRSTPKRFNKSSLVILVGFAIRVFAKARTLFHPGLAALPIHAARARLPREGLLGCGNADAAFHPEVGPAY